MNNLVRPITIKTSSIKASLIYAGFFMSLCFNLHAFAEAADRDKPIELEADTVTVNDAKKISTYAGNVILTQGTLIIKADKLIVREDKEGFQHSTSTGNPTTFKQKREGVNEYMEGSAQRIEYDGRMDKVQLYTRAWVKRGEDVVHGDYISYDANAEYAEVIGGTKTENGVTSSGRVKAIIQPKNKPAQPKPSSQLEAPQSEPSSGAGAAPSVTKTLRFSNKLTTTDNPETPTSE
jgi:lipopolysaccharide export system protein LptA